MSGTGANVGDGVCNVTTPGTKVKLDSGTLAAPSGPIKKVMVTARSTNTNVVTVGGSTVVGAAATRRGVGLPASATQTFETDDLGDLWVDAVTAGEGVSFLWIA